MHDTIKVFNMRYNRKYKYFVLKTNFHEESCCHFEVDFFKGLLNYGRRVYRVSQ